MVVRRIIVGRGHIMQNIVALFTSMFLAVSAFFAGLPHAIYAWDKPGQTVTDTAAVLALYKDVAGKNTETRFREKLNYGDLVDGRTDFLAQYAAAWARVGMFFINPNFYKVADGMPGDPASLKTSDLLNARAEYYHDGKTIVITFDLPDQIDKTNAKSNNQSVARAVGSFTDAEFVSVKVQVAKLGYTLKSATLTYSDAHVMIRADVATGKIVKASFTYHAQVSAEREEVALPFKQSFDYVRKLP